MDFYILSYFIINILLTISLPSRNNGTLVFINVFFALPIVILFYGIAALMGLYYFGISKRGELNLTLVEHSDGIKEVLDTFSKIEIELKEKPSDSESDTGEVL